MSLPSAGSINSPMYITRPIVTFVVLSMELTVDVARQLDVIVRTLENANLQARSKLPKRRRRVLPVTPRRPRSPHPSYVDNDDQRLTANLTSKSTIDLTPRSTITESENTLRLQVPTTTRALIARSFTPIVYCDTLQIFVI